MSIAVGLRTTLNSSGRDDVAFVTRRGADSEMTSILTRDDSRMVAMWLALRVTRRTRCCRRSYSLWRCSAE